MRQAARIGLGAALLALGCHRGSEPQATGTAPGATPAPPAARTPLPPSERVFVVQLTPRPDVDHVLGADGGALWAKKPLPDGGVEVLWREEGTGTVQLVAAGDLGRGRRLYVARGMSRADRIAPLVLEELDPGTGQAKELWRFNGERNEAAHLSVSDVDRDGRPDLAFAYFASKYEVRTHHVRADGKIVEEAPIRMATGRVYADVDGDGVTDEVVARIYGDGHNTPGDLRVDLGHGWLGIPTDRGVRAVTVASKGPERPAIYFADGWDAAYGTNARAQLSRARWIDGRFEVERIGASPDEFTFFELTTFDPAGTLAIAARGNKRLTVFQEAATSPWVSRSVGDVGEVLQTALGRDGRGRWVLYAPDPKATRVLEVQGPGLPAL